jgi:hypothetical protein
MWYFVCLINVQFLVVLLEYLKVRRLLATWICDACRSISVFVYHRNSCCRQTLLCVISRGLVQCYITFVVRAIFRLSSRYLCSYETMLLCFTIPSELTYACEIFASVYPLLFHLPTLEYLVIFLRWDLAVIFEGHRAIMSWSTTVFERDIPVSFSLQRQISQPASVFPKMETCKPFPKLDFWYIPQGEFKINFYMGLDYSYCREGRDIE